MGNFIDITGRRFGKLLVVGVAKWRIGKSITWNCVCDCGGKKRTCAWNLKTGQTKSCGCLVLHPTKETIQKRQTHGLTGTRVYSSWRSMLDRCYRKNCQQYPTYGGRGIKTCEFIRCSPLNLKSLIGDRPLKMTLDRKNNDGNYSCGQCAECLEKAWPKNIRWATDSQQCRNKGSNRMVLIEGIKKCVTDWAEEVNIPNHRIFSRLLGGWSGKRLLSPLDQRRKVNK